jgi:glycosyltransferase involved in cell wall biosynthesis
VETISCLMVTRDDRFEHFKRSFECFCRQDYTNKELIIIVNGGAHYERLLRTYIEGRKRADVYVERASVHLKVGALRNLAVDRARGEVVCQWDDDDLNHPQRISQQAERMRHTGAEVSFLVDHLHLFWSSKKLTWLNWIRAPRYTGHPGTLLAYKRALPRYDDALSTSEDSVLQRCVRSAGQLIAAIDGLGWSYLYTYHGTNNFCEEHHKRLVRCLGLERATLDQKRSLISSSLADYAIDPPVFVVDHVDQWAFQWNGGSACNQSP